MKVFEGWMKELLLFRFVKLVKSSIHEELCYEWLIRFSDYFEDVSAESLHGESEF
jgi:hypothetical protein